MIPGDALWGGPSLRVRRPVLVGDSQTRPTLPRAPRKLTGRLMSVAEIDFDEGVLMPIGVETLCAANVLPFDLYLPGEGRSRLVLYRERKHPIAESDLSGWSQRGVRTLYIAQGDSANYREYLRDTILKNDDIPPCSDTRSSARPRGPCLPRP